LSQALTAAADVVTSTFTSADDNITGTPATYGAGDVLVDGSSTDNDTLTITMAAGGAVGPAATVTGIENLIFNNTSISTAAAVDASNVIGAHITVNSIANTLVAMDSATITNVGTNSSVTLGTNIDGSDGNTSTVETANSAANVTVNTGAAIASVDLGTKAAGTTINGGAGSSALTVRMDWANAASAAADLNTNTTVNAATTGAITVSNNGATGTTITTTGTGTAAQTVSVTNVSNTSITVAKVGTAASATTIGVDGITLGAATNAATISAAGAITLETINGGQQVEILTLSGNGAAVTYALDGTGDQPLSMVAAGDQNVTMTMTSAQAAGHTTGITDTSSATSTVVIRDAITADRNLTKIVVDAIEAQAAITATKIITLNEGQLLNFTTVAQANAFVLASSDGVAVDSAAGVINLGLGQNITGAVTFSAGGALAANPDTVNTVNATATVAQTALDIRANTTAGVVNLKGAVAITAAATSTAFKLNGAELTGALTATMSGNMKDVVGGSGNDVFNGVTTSTASSKIDGGAGNDTFKVAVGGVSANTGYALSNIEVIDIAGANAAVSFASSQLSGTTYIMKGAGTDDVITLNGNATAAHIDTTTIDLSGLTFTAASTTTINVTGFDTTKFASSQAFTVTGSSVIDAITGSANADSLSGGAGADIIAGAAGADTINGDAGADIIGGGAGADIIDGGAGADVITGGTGLNVMTGGAGADTFEFAAADTAAAVVTAAQASIADFTIGAKGTGDDIGWDATNTTGATGATAASSGQAQIATAGAAAVFHTADNTLALKIVATEAAIAAFNGVTAADGQAAHFVDGGNTYIVISQGADGMAAQDAVIALTGLDASANTLTVDTNHLVLI
jgi:hypothetical protein